jgi:hypothetical protein
MSFMIDYIKNPVDFQDELKRLISEYNQIRGTYLFVYYVATEKTNLNIQLDQQDYYAIQEVLSGKDQKKIDFYVETRGGSAETVEEIVKFLRKHFEEVCFVVSGEAKSAGTLLVLSGDDIFMTETGSLGPIDAQMKIGRSWVSAYSYMEWIDKRRKEASEGKLNQFDAIMAAQISPGEVVGVNDALNFATDLANDWLPRYKFKDWTETETRKIPVSKEDRESRAKEIVGKLIAHSHWKTHGRSLKIEDLQSIGLSIKNLDADYPRLAEIVYRIQALCTLNLGGSDIYKTFATADDLLNKVAPQKPVASKSEEVLYLDTRCPSCGAVHHLYGKLGVPASLEVELKSRGVIPVNIGDKIKCTCGQDIDLHTIRKQIKEKTGRDVCQ